MRKIYPQVSDLISKWQKIYLQFINLTNIYQSITGPDKGKNLSTANIDFIKSL